MDARRYVSALLLSSKPGWSRISSRSSRGGATSPLGYTGQLTDSQSNPASGQTGFVDLRARMYDPATGQFLQRDSYAGSTGSATSLNH